MQGQGIARAAAPPFRLLLQRRHLGHALEVCGKRLVCAIGAKQQCPALAQAVESGIQRQFAMAQHQHPITDSVHLLHDMGGQDHRGLPCQSRNQAPHVFGLLRVQAIGGFVEDQQARFPQDSLGYTHPLPEAA